MKLLIDESLSARVAALLVAADHDAIHLGNLALVCSRHHHLLHRPGWQAKLLSDATFEVTRPHGRALATKPPSRTPPLPLTP